jgi:hypothetical protein
MVSKRVVSGVEGLGGNRGAQRGTCSRGKYVVLPLGQSTFRLIALDDLSSKVGAFEEFISEYVVRLATAFVRKFFHVPLVGNGTYQTSEVSLFLGVRYVERAVALQISK